MTRRLAFRPLLVVALLLAPLCAGCYFTDLAGRQLALLNEQQPLPRAIATERDPRRSALLRMVPDLRAFARDVMQLPVRGSYAGYYATERRAIAFVLVASEKTRLRAYSWWFPIVGSVAYKSFVHEADARAAARELERAGYDTWVGPVTAYSTLGLLRDPVTTVMMRRGTVSFVEVMLHEMTHARLYVAGQTDWDEQLASFVGRVGATRYIRSRFAQAPALLRELQDHEQRRRQVDRAVRATLSALRRLYGSSRSTAETLRARGPIFAKLRAELIRLEPDEDPSELEVNNARMLQFQRYLAGAEELERMWRSAGRSFVRFWPLVERRAAQF